MLFLAPLTLIGLALVALPVVIHLLARRRGRRLDFPSLEYLRETPSFKLRPRRLRQPLLLALRVAAIVLLVLGLARPLLTLRTPTHETIHFILMDASLSMKARGRAEAAKEQARSLINKLGSDERACVISFSSEARVLMGASADKSRLLEAVEGYKPEGGAADYDAGFREISRQLQREPQSEAEADIISDFQKTWLDGREEAASKNEVSRIVTYPVGAEVLSNASLIDESVKSTERGVELSATEMVSEAGGRMGARHVWTIDGSEGERSGIEWRTESDGRITGRLEALGPDDFDADDERFFAFRPPRQARTLFIETGGEASLFIRAALATAGDGLGQAALDGRQEIPGSAAELSPYSSVVVMLRGAPRENQLKALAEYARSGGNVWMLLARDLDAESLSAFASREESGLPCKSITRISGKSLSFGAADEDAEVFRSLDPGALRALRGVRVHEGYALETRESAETLLRWNDGSAAFVSERIGAGQIMLLGSSPERAASELGASPAFPALASSILRASASTDEPLSRTVGEPLRLGVRPEVGVKITSAAGRVAGTTAGELFMHPLAYISEPGIYRLEVAGAQARFVAFNSPVAESERSLSTENDLRRRFEVEEKGRVRNESGWREAAERGGSLWRYFLVAAFLLLIGELLLVARQRRVSEMIE